MKVYTVLGVIVIAAAIVGLLTVADDLRHRGELAAVAGRLVAGIALLSAGVSARIRTNFAMQWVAIGIGLGLLCGSAADEVVGGGVIGALAGLLTARLRRSRA